MNPGRTSLENLSRLRSGITSKRWDSHDPTGGNHDCWEFEPGETKVLAETSKPGCIRHIWMTTYNGAINLRGMILRMYWDGEETPSVLCPLGDFFGLGHGQAVYYQAFPMQAFHMGLNCWFPMPFAKGARIEVTNQRKEPTLLYFYINYQELPSLDPEQARFHANWRREHVKKKQCPEGPDAVGKTEALNTSGKDNYLILDTEGAGHYVGCFLHLDTKEGNWWGEGDDMFFIDGTKWPPDIHGTGTEDYFCGAWGYNGPGESYFTPYYGYHCLGGNKDFSGKHSQYRFHVEDPIYFHKSLRFSIEHGHANNKEGDWSSTAYWYQVNRTKPLPELGALDDRMPWPDS